MDKLSDINDYHYTVYILCMRHMNVSSLNNKQRKKQICLIRLGNQIMRSIDTSKRLSITKCGFLRDGVLVMISNEA